MLTRRPARARPPVQKWAVLLGDLDLISLSGPSVWARAAWPGANRGIYLPLRLPFDGFVTTVEYDSNSTTGTGDLGFYTGAGNKIVTRGATANVVGSNTWTLSGGLWLRAGVRYQMAMSMSSTTPTPVRTSTLALNALRPIGVAQEASVATLPATLTPAQVAGNYVPLIVLTFGNV